MNRRVCTVLFLCLLSAGTMLAEEKKAADEQQSIVSPQPDRKPLLLRTHSTGAMQIALEAHFDHQLVARFNEAGELELTCTDDHELAAMLVAEKPDTILRIRGARAERRRAERE